jgi:hypothetical protein
MARGPRPFTESDVKAALNGALKAGCEVARLEIDLARKIVLIMGKPQGAAPNELDQELAAFEARHGQH